MFGFDWDADLPEAQRNEIVETLALKVHGKGLHVPAILFLEMHKPLAFLAGQSLILGSGFLGPIFGPQNVQRYSKFLESRDNVERLIQRIEELKVGGAAADTPKSPGAENAPA